MGKQALTKVIFFENQVFQELEDTVQDHLKVVFRSLPGMQLDSTGQWSHCVSKLKKSNSLLIYCCDGNWLQSSQETLQQLAQGVPYPYPLGVLFLLFDKSVFVDFQEWILHLDRCYDQPFPVQFCFYQNEDPFRDSFFISGGALALCREMDSLSEIQLLSARVRQVEESLNHTLNSLDSIT